MNFLADTTPSEVTPAVMGMGVIILLQLSQFYFAFRKDQRSSEAVRKEDLVSLRKELKADIHGVAEELDELRESFEKKSEASRLESERARGEIQKAIGENAMKTAALVEGVETLKQTSYALQQKIDTLRKS